MTRRSSQWLLLLAAVALLAGTVFFNGRQMQARANQPLPKPEPAPQRLEVSVISVEAQARAASLEAYGEARAHFELALTAQSSGRVQRLADSFESGRQVPQGGLLLELEDSDYRAAVASAEYDLATARQSLLEEEREGQQARDEWVSSGLDGKPDSELVLRGPQLASAKAAVTSASAALQHAREALEQTRIKAPFDALVVERQVSPGAYVQSGDEVATLYSTDRVEIELELSARDWQMLPDTDTLTGGHWPVELTGVEDGRHWTGRVQRVARHLTSETRQRALVVAVDQPLAQSPALLPGTFVRASIPGRSLDQLWRLPGSALSQQGRIWYLTADDRLAAFDASPLFATGDEMYIEPPEALRAAPQRVLTHPLSSYVEGMAATALQEVSDNG